MALLSIVASLIMFFVAADRYTLAAATGTRARGVGEASVAHSALVQPLAVRPMIASDTITDTPTVTSTATTGPTDTATASMTLTASATDTETPSATATATSTVTATPTATVTDSPTLAVCPLAVTPNPQVIEQGGSVALTFATQANVTITAAVQSGAPYPDRATVFNDVPGNPGVPLAGIAVTGGFQYSFSSGFGGSALLVFPIPATAPVGPLQIQATAVCGAQQASGQTVLSVVPAQGIPPTNHLTLRLHALLIRSAALPPAAGSIAHTTVTAWCSPGDLAILSATIHSSNTTSLGTTADGGTAYTEGMSIFTAVLTADAGGYATFSLPLSSSLLIPGKGGVVRTTLTCAQGARSAVYRTSFALREVGLRLLATTPALSRGGLRQTFLIGQKSNGSSTLKALVLADGGAHISASATIGGANIPAMHQPLVVGAGRRVLLTFVVPNTMAPALRTHRTATITI